METIAQEKYEGSFWQELVAHDLSNTICNISDDAAKRATLVQCEICGIWGTEEQMIFRGIGLDEDEGKLVDKWRCVVCYDDEMDVA
jgi:hypothetical protein